MQRDDIVSVGDRDHNKTFQENMATIFEIKTTMLGDALGEGKEGRVLSRIIRITESGWEYEPDQRHADIIVEAMNLQKSKGVSTSTEYEKAWEADANDEKLTTEKATTFRRIAARANYLAADSPI